MKNLDNNRNRYNTIIRGIIYSIPIVFGLISTALILIEIDYNRLFGFSSNDFQIFYIITIFIFSGFSLLNTIKNFKLKRYNIFTFDILLTLLLSLILLNHFGIVAIESLGLRRYIYIAILLSFIREIITFSYLKFKIALNPAQLFALSFFIIIMGGSLLLLLPASTYDGISYLDALFTSTSAVCVTGLIVVDTGSYFTFFGQMVIMALIQIGGLGIMTFTSYFSYFFKGGSSYQNQLLMMKMTNSEKLADVFSTLKLIIFITFLIEAIGGTIIFFSIDKTVIESFNDRVFFSAFHSVSGFCNAGFSTLQESLYQPAFRFNYPLHLTIAFLFVLGGLGFPIFFNLIRYIRHIIIKSFHLLFTNRKDLSLPWVINLNTRIILISTSILILVGTIGFYILEYNNTLAEHSGLGKVVTAFFGAVTPRTAGFNTVDTSALGYPTVLFVIFLMWIGASPASTGGGIKTSTFAVGIINIFSAIKGKKDVELYGREISNFSIKRANSIIILSLLTIGLGIFSISLVDSHLGLLSITFETFSAFSTVGLSRGITANLSSFSKFIIIITMFVGRISVLTLLIALFRRERHRSYRYPSEDILIN